MLNIIYYWQIHKKINGTLFYCFEYYLYFKYIKNINVKFNIIGISDKDLKMINNLFNDKYKDEYNNQKISSITKTGLYKLDGIFLMLDLKSYEYSSFCKNTIHLFYEKGDTNIKANTLSYGSYNEYQKFEIYNIIKLGLQFQKTYTNGTLTYYSGANPKIFKRYNNNKSLNKNFDNFIPKLFSKINKIVYVHSSLDSNNRIIIEAKYHKIELEIIEECKIIDSVFYRKNDNINNYILSDDDKIVQNILKELNEYK